MSSVDLSNTNTSGASFGKKPPTASSPLCPPLRLAGGGNGNGAARQQQQRQSSSRHHSQENPQLLEAQDLLVHSIGEGSWEAQSRSTASKRTTRYSPRASLEGDDKSTSHSLLLTSISTLSTTPSHSHHRHSTSHQSPLLPPQQQQQRKSTTQSKRYVMQDRMRNTGGGGGDGGGSEASAHAAKSPQRLGANRSKHHHQQHRSSHASAKNESSTSVHSAVVPHLIPVLQEEEDATVSKLQQHTPPSLQQSQQQQQQQPSSHRPAPKPKQVARSPTSTARRPAPPALQSWQEEGASQRISGGGKAATTLSTTHQHHHHQRAPTVTSNTSSTVTRNVPPSLTATATVKTAGGGGGVRKPAVSITTEGRPGGKAHPPPVHTLTMTIPDAGTAPSKPVMMDDVWSPVSMAQGGGGGGPMHRAGLGGRMGGGTQSPLPPPHQPQSPEEALLKFRSYLNQYEQSEIMDYRHIYYCGQQSSTRRVNRRPTMSSSMSASCSFSQPPLAFTVPVFDDADGYYLCNTGDQVAYRYEIQSVVGRGTYSLVAHAVDWKYPANHPWSLCALKIARAEPLYNEAAEEEEELLSQLTHVYLTQRKYGRRPSSPCRKGGTVADTDPSTFLANAKTMESASLPVMYDSFVFRQHRVLVFPLYGRDLRTAMKSSRQPFPNYVTRSITHQLLVALHTLHHCGITHADVKPDNIIFSSRSDVGAYCGGSGMELCGNSIGEDSSASAIVNKKKRPSSEDVGSIPSIGAGGGVDSTPNSSRVILIDFSNARYTSSEPTFPTQSPYYRSPEAALQLPYTSAMDMWSLGCVVYEMVTKQKLMALPSSLTTFASSPSSFSRPTSGLLSPSASLAPVLTNTELLARSIGTLGFPDKVFTTKIKQVWKKYIHERPQLRHRWRCLSTQVREDPGSLVIPSSGSVSMEMGSPPAGSPEEVEECWLSFFLLLTRQAESQRARPTSDRNSSSSPPFVSPHPSPRGNGWVETNLDQTISASSLMSGTGNAESLLGMSANGASLSQPGIITALQVEPMLAHFGVEAQNHAVTQVLQRKAGTGHAKGVLYHCSGGSGPTSATSRGCPMEGFRLRHDTGVMDVVRLPHDVDSFILLDFLLGCLTWSPEERLTAAEALRHPWVSLFSGHSSQHTDHHLSSNTILVGPDDPPIREERCTGSYYLHHHTATQQCGEVAVVAKRVIANEEALLHSRGSSNSTMNPQFPLQSYGASSLTLNAKLASPITASGLSLLYQLATKP